MEEKPTTELPNNKVYDIGDDIFGNCEKKYMNNRETAEYCLGVVKELSEDVKFNILEVLAPYGSQISSSCRGLVAFGHQMGALWALWLVKLKFGALRAPPSSSCGGLMAFVHLIWVMFVYEFRCFCFIHHGTPTGSFPESFVKIRLDLAEVVRI